MLEFALSSIRPDPHQPRTRFNEASLKELSESIKRHGVLCPLLVTKGEGCWDLVAGERRYRAAEMAGLKKVPVVVQERLHPGGRLEVQILENLQRADLDPLELAHAYQRLVTEHGYSQTKVAERVHKSAGHVSQHLGLLALPEDVQSRLRVGELGFSHAAALLPLAGDPDRCSRAARAIAGGMLTVGEAQQLVARYRGGSPSAGSGALTYGRAAVTLRDALELTADRGYPELAALLEQPGPALIDALADWFRALPARSEGEPSL
jgi:ParB family chromosome partitioning protein